MLTLLHFIFKLGPESGGNCMDKFELYDGQSTADPPLLTNYCGSELPAPLVTTGRHLHAYFTSNRDGRYGGASVFYKQCKINACTVFHLGISLTINPSCIYTLKCQNMANGFSTIRQTIISSLDSGLHI